MCRPHPPEPAAFDFDKNLVFGSARLNGDPNLRHATLKFPKPHAIVSDRTELLGDTHFSSPPGNTVKRVRVSEIQVFRYDTAVFPTIRLGLAKIDVNSFDVGADKFVNLHFFADSPRVETSDEGEQALYIACHQLLNSSVWLKTSPHVNNTAPQARACLPAEILPLSSRVRSAGEHVAKWRNSTVETGNAFPQCQLRGRRTRQLRSVLATEEPLP